MTLEQLVTDLATSQQLRDKGFPQDTAMVWFIYGESVQLLNREQVETFEKPNDEGVAAPTAGELMKWIRAKYPDAEITSRCVWPGAAWIVRYQDDSFKNAHGDTEIAALAALVLEVAG